MVPRLLLFAALAVSSLTLSAAPSGFRLVWNDDPTSTICIGWIDDGGADPHVMFGTQADGSDEARFDSIISKTYDADGTGSGTVDPEGDPLVSSFVNITSLLPDTAYYFRVVSGGVSSDRMWFLTAPDTPSDFTFIAGGDSRDASGEPTSNRIGRVYGAELVAKIRPLFVAHGGDYISRFAGGSTNNEWRRWLLEWQNTKSEDGRMYPILPAHGNHENDVIETLSVIFNITDANGGDQGGYYAHSIGGTQMRLYTLNTEIQPFIGYALFEDLDMADWEQLWEDQNAWLNADMAQNADTHTWVVANYHRPMRPHRQSKLEGENSLGQGTLIDWRDAFDGNVDLAIECDTHIAKYTFPVSFSDGDGSYETFIRDDANGILFTGEGSWGAPLRPNNDIKPWTMASSSFWQYKLVHVKTNPDQLDIHTVRFIDRDDVTRVRALTQAEQDADPLAVPQDIDLWNPLPGSVITLPFTGAEIDQRAIIPTNDVWRYDDSGADLGIAWIDPTFDDSGWSEGQTEFGFGDEDLDNNVPADEETTLATDATTYYFRNTFDLTQGEIADMLKLDVHLKYDDGAIIYINGTEYIRENLPKGDITFETEAILDRDRDLTAGATFSDFTNNEEENEFITFPVPIESLNAGSNVIAVEIHQTEVAAGQDDLSMELVLNAVTTNADIAAPFAPTSLYAQGVSTNEILISWDGQFDAVTKAFELQYRIADGPWQVLENEINQYDPLSDDITQDFVPRFERPTFSHFNLEPNTRVTYRVRAYNGGGSSAWSNPFAASTQVAPPIVVFEDFEDVPTSSSFQREIGIFTNVNVLEPSKFWQVVRWNFGTTNAAQGNNFGGGAGPTEDWLILSDPIDFDALSAESVEVGGQISFSGPNPQLLVSTDYTFGDDPENPNDPNDFTWDVLHTFPGDLGQVDFVPQGPFDLSDYTGQGRIAVKYTGEGGSGGQSYRFTIDNFAIRGLAPLISSDFAAGLSPFTAFDLASTANWATGIVDSVDAAVIDGTTGDAAADDWLISPALNVGSVNGATLGFDVYPSGTDSGDVTPLQVFVSSSYTGGQPDIADWVDVTPAGLTSAPDGVWTTISTDVPQLSGDDVYLAFRYQSSGAEAGSAKRVALANIQASEILPIGATVDAQRQWVLAGQTAVFSSTVSGVPPFQYQWSFGDGGISTSPNPTHVYSAAGRYDVSLTVTDRGGLGDSVTVALDDFMRVAEPSANIFEKQGDLRIAAFNVAMSVNSTSIFTIDDFNENLTDGNSSQIQGVAEIIQRVRPDILLINEYDYDGSAESQQALQNFIGLYLQVPQAGDVEGIFYPYIYTPVDGNFRDLSDSNTGVNTGLQPETVNPDWDFDFDNGTDTRESRQPRDSAADAFGFGRYEGHFAMIVLSRFPILTDEVRTFQRFLWKDMPGAFLPADPEDITGGEVAADAPDDEPDSKVDAWYSDDELEAFRLSSKTHWDIPVNFKGHTIHVLASHPTPPTFDGIEDRNGTRNHDEIRFFADYIEPGLGDYIYDDEEWVAAGNETPANPSGNLGGNKRFIILGDQNADPDDGDATDNPIRLILNSPFVDTTVTPESDGSDEAIAATSGSRRSKTSEFGLRADYALPSAYGWDIVDAGVFWPINADPLADLARQSDHRLVYVDMAIDLEGQQTPFVDFDTWKATYGHFLPEDIDSVTRDDDVDEDGQSALQEFIFLGDPNRPDPARGRPTVRLTPSQEVALAFSMIDSDQVAWRILKSEDITLPLDQWDLAEAGTDYTVVESRSANDPNAIERNITLTGTSNTRATFYVLEAQEATPSEN